jgi:saccharopine dehydrogenase-like NADP-dependent oxidoreductase
MKSLAILGLGHIGSTVLRTLQGDTNFSVGGYDLSTGHDCSDPTVLHSIISECDGVLACTPFFLNKQIADICHYYSADYFDLTESVDVTEHVKRLAQGGGESKFVTQCGLAPGMVSIIAAHLANQLDRIDSIQIRVGALPQSSNNSMQYSRTWNTHGLINEYINPCTALVDSKIVQLAPLADVELVNFNGLQLEAANTSGGIGSLADTYCGIAQQVNYKTLRYPGHWTATKVLQQLGLAEEFDTYVDLFNKYIPVTSDDVIYILINAIGWVDGTKVVRTYKNCIYSTEAATAIQISTAGGVMAVLDIWANGHLDSMRGWIKQENLSYNSVWASKYSTAYHEKNYKS